MSLRLPAVFSDHAVLQQKHPARIWGWDAPGQRVTITLGGQEATCVADASGSWKAQLPELPAGGPYTLRVAGSSTIVRNDLLCGEVWVASGQSNMEWPLSMANHWAGERSKTHRPTVRLLQVPQHCAFSPREDLVGRWAVCNEQTAAGFSAVAYCFGVRLSEELGVPIGLINTSWGGTRVEAWTSESALKQVMDLDADHAQYPSDEADLHEMAKTHLAEFTAWELEHLPGDPGNTGYPAGWAKPEFDDADWKDMPVPGFWQVQGWNHNGSVWYRRSIEIPAEWVGKALNLSLGTVDDFDWAYVNGTQVGATPKGTPAAYQIQRVYPVPASLVSSRRLTVAVRVFDHFGHGGFSGVEPSLSPADAPGVPVTLQGTWRAKVEHAIANVPGDIFATAPPQPYMMQPQNRATSLFNGMIAPLIPYAIRGAIWYQGESNVDKYSSYRERFVAMIRDWRTRWNQGEFPFLFVQLANFAGGAGWPYLQEAQTQSRHEPNTGMALAVDIGEPGDIHPTNKLEVGNRLARIALKRTYGKGDIVDRGPSWTDLQVVDGGVRVRFDCQRPLKTTDGWPPRAFELVSQDGQTVPADATIADESFVHLKFPLGFVGSTVRYAFSSNPGVNLTDASGLPAEPFRTDAPKPPTFERSDH